MAPTGASCVYGAGYVRGIRRVMVPHLDRRKVVDAGKNSFTLPRERVSTTTMLSSRSPGPLHLRSRGPGGRHRDEEQVAGHGVDHPAAQGARAGKRARAIVMEPRQSRSMLVCPTIIRIASGGPHPLCTGKETSGGEAAFLAGVPMAGRRPFVHPGQPASQLIVEKRDEVPVRTGVRRMRFKWNAASSSEPVNKVQETQGNRGRPGDALPAVKSG